MFTLIIYLFIIHNIVLIIIIIILKYISIVSNILSDICSTKIKNIQHLIKPILLLSISALGNKFIYMYIFMIIIIYFTFYWM